MGNLSPSSLISGCFSIKVKTYHNVHISELTAAQLEYFCLSFFWKELKASMQKVFIILFLPVQKNGASCHHDNHLTETA